MLEFLTDNIGVALLVALAFAVGVAIERARWRHRLKADAQWRKSMTEFADNHRPNFLGPK